MAIALCSVARTAARAQDVSSSDRGLGHLMLRAVRTDVMRQYYDSTYGGNDVAARFDSADAHVERARSLDEMMAAIAQVLLGLGDSHTLFLPPARTVDVAYGWDMQMIGDSCYVTRVDSGSDAAAQAVHPGDAVLLVNGYRPTRRNVGQLGYLYHALRPQPGLRVVMRAPGGAPRQLDLAASVRRLPSRVDLTGQDGGTDLWRLIREADSDAERWRTRYVEIGDRALVWRLRTFEVEEDEGGELLKRGRGKKAIVLDLRGNGGGAVRTLGAMLGAFYENDQPIATVHRRRETSAMVARGSGAKRIEAPLVVLVDSRSASAAELFARTVQLTHRGTVIGDATAGAVMESRVYAHRVGPEVAVFYAASVATGSVELPDGGKLEGVGVTPDEIVCPTPADLAAGRDPALARALTLAGVPTTTEEAGRLFTAH